MPSLNDVKTLGGIGSLLTLLSIVPTVGVVLGIAGLILVLIAMKYASDILGDAKIFTNMIYAVVLGIIGLIVGVVAVIALVFQAVGLNFLSSSFAYTSTTATTGDIMSLLGTILIGLAAVWICLLISSIFLRRSFNELGKRLNVSLFGTGALLYFIGAILTIVLIGFILIFIAEILFLVAFFSINTQTPPTPTPVMPSSHLPVVFEKAMSSCASDTLTAVSATPLTISTLFKSEFI
jgi:uncharacterized membrane protein